MLYNDAYRPITGKKHPASMGQRGRDCWPEIWDVIGPMLRQVLEQGEATWSENQLLLINRRGYRVDREECFFTFSYSPIAGSDGAVAGVFCAVAETTAEVLGKRRMATLRELDEATADARDPKTACSAALLALGGNPSDVPFALLYLVEDEHARLAAATGLQAGSDLAPQIVAVDRADGVWPLLRAGGRADVEDLSAWSGVPYGTKWAIVLPVQEPAAAI